MVAIAINNVTVSAKEGSIRQSSKRIGSVSRSIVGNGRSSERSERETIRLQTTSLPNSEAFAIANLAIGYFHVGSFDGETNLSSSANADLGSGCHLSISEGWSGDALAVRSGSSASWLLQLPDEWTVLVRRFDSTSNTWQRLAYRSDGQQWIDEVAQIGGVQNCLNVSAGAVTLYGKTLANVNQESLYDELFVMPWFCPETILLQLSANEQTHSPGPFVTINGDVVKYPIGMITRGFVEDGKYVPRGAARTRRDQLPNGAHSLDIDWLNNAIELSLGFDEDTALSSAVNSAPTPTAYFPLRQQLTASNLSTSKNAMNITAANATRIGTGAEFAAGPAREINGAIKVASGTHYNVASSAELTSLQGAAGAGTIAFWVKFDTLTGAIVCKEDGTDREWIVSASGGLLTFRAYGNTGGTIHKTYPMNSTPVVAGVWYFFAVSFANNSGTPVVRVLANSEPSKPAATTVGAYSAIPATTSAVGIGDRAVPSGSSLPIAATFAHVMFFGTALTNELMRRVYLTTKRMQNVGRT